MWWKLLTPGKTVNVEETKQQRNSPPSPVPYALRSARKEINATPSSPLNKKVLFAVTPTPSVGKDAPLKKRKREHNETGKSEEGDVATGATGANTEFEEQISEKEGDVSSLELTQRQLGLGPCYFVPGTQSDGTQSDGTQLGTQPEGLHNLGPKEISKEVSFRIWNFFYICMNTLFMMEWYFIYSVF